MKEQVILNRLRPYQILDVTFLSKLKSCANFSEQRTGKTPTSLITLKAKSIKKFFVLCPKSACYQWADEIKEWLNVPCVVVDGTQQKKQKQIQEWTDALVVGYDSFKATSKSSGTIRTILAHKPEAIIADEAHHAKNPKSAIAQALFATREVPFKLALTGTPAPNKPWEVFSILHWLQPDSFPSYWKFIDMYFNTQRRTLSSGRSFIEVTGFKQGHDTLLQHKLAEFSVQHKRKDVMLWLPTKDYTKVRLPLTKEQTKYLNELKEYFETEHIVTQGVLDRLIRYRQICNAPALLDLKGKSPKQEWLAQYIQDNPDKPIIIFSKFTSWINIIKKQLKIPAITGATPIQERHKLKLAFQKGQLKQLLINIDAGKEALTLDKAEACVFLDKYPPAGDIAQAEDRFVATIKENANKPHEIIELMMADSYDEQLYNLVKKNATATDVINSFSKYIK